MDSILTSIKKLLGIGADNTDFDSDIIMFINSVFPTLAQIGVSSADGFLIQNANAVWSDLIPEDHKELESIKSYIYLKVKLVFDPPLSSAVMSSMERMITEAEWRINHFAEKSQNG